MNTFLIVMLMISMSSFLISFLHCMYYAINPHYLSSAIDSISCIFFGFVSLFLATIILLFLLRSHFVLLG